MAVVPCPLSADSPAALSAAARELAAEAAADPALTPAALGRRLAAQPAAAHRAAVVAASRDGLLAGLAALASGERADGLYRGQALPGPGDVLVFPGQGSQWPGMALDLHASSPAFRGQLDRAAAELKPWVGWDLLDVLAGKPGTPGLETPDVVQPALFAVMVSLAAQWEAFGVRPAAVIGHSQGEIAAAYTAGILSLADAVRVVVMRGRVLRRLTGRGGMLSVPMPAAWVERYVAGQAGGLAVAAINGPSSIVVSGDVPALHALAGRCAAEGVRARMVKVDYPSHSPQIDEVRGELLAGIGAITAAAGHTAYYSCVTGGLVPGTTLTAEYWYQNLRQTVRFDSTVRSTVATGHRRFIEVSPHPVVIYGMQLVLRDTPDTAIAGSLRRDEGGMERFTCSAAEAFVHGADVTWPAALFGD